MSRSSDEVKAEMVKEALDTVEVINITDEDFIIHNDKMRPTRTKWIIPNKNKDLGKGKGKQHVPAFVGWRYMNLALNKVITQISQKDWDAKKDEYKDAERSKHEERLAIRTNNPKLTEEIAKTMWGGIVERYGGDEILEPAPKVKTTQTRKGMKEYLASIGLSNKLVEQSQDDLIKEIE